MRAAARSAAVIASTAGWTRSWRAAAMVAVARSSPAVSIRAIARPWDHTVAISGPAIRRATAGGTGSAPPCPAGVASAARSVAITAARCGASSRSGGAMRNAAYTIAAAVRKTRLGSVHTHTSATMRRVMSALRRTHAARRGSADT
jgi:hypothetical protein